MLFDADMKRHLFVFLRYACGISAVCSTVAALTCFFVGSGSAWGYVIVTPLNIFGVQVARRQIRLLDEARVLASPEFQALLNAMKQMFDDVGSAITPPMQALAAAVNGMLPAFEQMAAVFRRALRSTYPNGTVQNPSDPSPFPRGVTRP